MAMATTTTLQNSSVYVWVDANVNTDKHCLHLQKKLMKSVKTLKTFDNVYNGTKFIKECDDKEIILIVSGSYGREIVSEVHDLPQLTVFYVYCSDRTRNEKWAKIYMKLGQVCTENKELTAVILSRPLTQSMSMKNSADQIDLNDVIWIRLLSEILVRMDDAETSRAINEFLEFWRNECRENINELKIIDEFKQTFEPQKALWWWTRECQLHRIINQNLRKLNFDNIYSLRYILKCIYAKLKEERRQFKNKSVTQLQLYCGVKVSVEEFESIKSKVGQIHYVNCILSTTLQMKVALHYVRNFSEQVNYVSVLFKIDVDIKFETLPIAVISQLSAFADEEEVVIMWGTIYQINSVFYDENIESWTIEISLSDENGEARLKEMVDYIKHEIKETTDLITLADLFVKMGEYERAKIYYIEYESQLSNDDIKRKRAFDGLSHLADIEGNYYVSMNQYVKAYECFNKQLELCEKLPSHHPQYGKCYANIANLYELQGQKDLALENYEKACKIYTQSLPAYHPDITKIEQSIENLSSEIKAKPLTFNRPNILQTTEIHEEISGVNTKLETFLIVWLDANVNKTQDNQKTYNELRASVNYIQTFENLQEGEECIRSIKGENIVLIVSGGYGREIVPKIHDLEQINCIYVYCTDKARNEEWPRDYSKIRSVITNRRKLIEEITEDQKFRNLTEDPVPMSILNRTTVAKETTAKDISKEMGSILWFQLLVDVLLRMTHTDDAKMELIQTWRENYSGNSSELDIIKEFKHQFKQDKAVWWYTRESSLYRILNKALREQSVDVIFAFRFFLTELSKQVLQLYNRYMNDLKSMNTKDNDMYIVHVYRGQAIAKEELEQMKASIGGFISINSFFSTSRSKTKARRFAERSSVNNHLNRVLFHIEIDRRLPTKPFADIEGISYYPAEREILFMLGSIFRINDIFYDDQNDLWILNLNLCSEDDFELKELFAYLKKDIGDETSMVTLGNILIQMGEYDEAERIFLRINHREGLIGVAEQKGNFYFAMKNYKSAIDHYKQALKLRCELFPKSHPDIGKSYNSIAMAYEFWKQYPKSIDYYQRTIEQYKRTLKDNHPLITQTKNSLEQLRRRMYH